MESEYQCKRLYCNQGAIRSVNFSIDGEYCVTSGSNKKIKLWNPYRGIVLKTYSGHANEVMDSYPSCDQSKIVSGSVDKTVIVWDVMVGTAIRRYRAHTGIVSTVRFNELATIIVSGSQDNTVMLWDVRNKASTPVQVISDAKDSISAVKVSDHEILTASYDAKVRRYDIREGRLITDCIGEIVTCASFTKDNRCILISCADGSIKLIDKDTGELLGEYKGLKRSEFCLQSSINHDDTMVVSGSSDGRIWIWDLISRKVLGHLSDKKSNQYPTVSIAVHPNKNCFLSANSQDILLFEKIGSVTDAKR